MKEAPLDESKLLASCEPYYADTTCGILCWRNWGKESMGNAMQRFLWSALRIAGVTMLLP